jgi:hypothetical protein
VELWPNDETQRRQWCRAQGIRPEQHCCLDLAYAIARPRLSPYQGPSVIVEWSAAWNEYRLPMAHDGYTPTPIRYCPWCGTRLPPSRREEWYRALRGLGIDDPGEADAVPPAFETDEWWRGQG